MELIQKLAHNRTVLQWLIKRQLSITLAESCGLRPEELSPTEAATEFLVV
jgi:hypothetical protein